MSSAADSNDREERFKHLLQPIRDLARNWDVDIATSLEDYLEDLEDITITLDGGASKVNFAEAALLIQGSTCVYSRKVEHVYQLVLRTIDFLTQQKQQKNANSNKNKNGDDGITEAEEAAFLPLDDILEGKHIDIDIDGGGHSSGRARNRRRSSVAPNNSFHGGRGNGHGKDGGGGGLSVGGDVPDITRPPMFLMEQDYGNSFKMSTCAPQQQSGTLLIEGGSLDETGGESLSLSLSHSSNTNSGGGKRACDFWRGLGREGDGGMKAPAAAEAERWTGDGMDNDDDDDSDGGGGGYGGDFGPDDDFDEPRDDVPLEGPRTPGSVSVSLSMAMAGGRELRQRTPKEVPKVDTTLTDPWAALDPHDPGTSQGLPIRKGRTYKLPPQLRKRRGSKKAQEGVGTGGGGEERKDAGGSWVGHDGKLTSSVPLLGLAYSEFQYVLHRERQRKAAQTRLARHQARVFMGREEFIPESGASNSFREAGAGAAGVDDGIGAYDGYGSDGSYGSDGGGGGDYGDLGDLGGGDGGYSDMEGDGYGGGGGDGGDAGVAPISLEDAFREKPQTYEDLCRSHIEAFMRGTEKYAHETQLSKRVGAWQEKLEPLLESQEKRQVFDIHAYGQSVLSRVASVLTPAQRAKANTAVKGVEHKAGESSLASLEEDAKTKDDDAGEPNLPLVDFGTVVAGKERFDVCRLFLASLQLANNGNVRLFHGDNAAEQESTPFQLELLTLQNSDNMSGCFAPSSSVADSGPDNPSDNPSENPSENGAKSGAKSGARRGAKTSTKAKAKSIGRRGGRGGVVGTTESIA